MAITDVPPKMALGVIDVNAFVILHKNFIQLVAHHS